MIYLVRHGEPAAGWGDHLDPGLSELGRRQAAAVAEVVATYGAKRAVTSPLARCRETGRPFEKLMETHARLDPDIGEIRTPAGLAPDARPAWLKGVMAGRWTDLEGGFAPWRNAALAAVERCPEETVIFSHFVAINAVVGLLTGDERVVIFRPGHCSVTRLVRRRGKLAVSELGSEGGLVAL